MTMWRLLKRSSSITPTSSSTRMKAHERLRSSQIITPPSKQPPQLTRSSLSIRLYCWKYTLSHAITLYPVSHSSVSLSCPSLQFWQLVSWHIAIHGLVTFLNAIYLSWAHVRDTFHSFIRDMISSSHFFFLLCSPFWRTVCIHGEFAHVYYRQFMISYSLPFCFSLAFNKFVLRRSACPHLAYITSFVTASE